ncbi:MAG: SDR family NAD(P)-dependent oxidoreductase, partial [Candidatus Scalindua sp.]|nr:SDR family NAD(P)-dependent oxidoreductase [Candidatus Scalindua sp.]
MRLKDKVAIVTGGSRGIGRAICVKLANEGAKVVVNYSEKADGGEFIGSADKVVDEIVSASGKAVAFEADVANRDSVYEMIDSTVREYGRLDIIVANAGICPFREFLEIDEELLDRVINVNFKGSFFCAQA